MKNKDNKIKDNACSECHLIVHPFRAKRGFMGNMCT